ncbi:hypothetical protein DFH11DRAFT_1561350 [Phellopilus nigrolimitatus]|nr:hypothetical protein DFH11DRAFT_1561350 [Phellopilus nigrolimitatus]
MQASTPAGDSTLTDDGISNLALPQPCLRHISSIQVRNLSPYPARDTVASVLTQRSTVTPAGASSGSGLASDDADILIGRRRNRRISSTSVGTLKSIRDEHEHDVTPTLETPSSRNRANSRASVHAPSISSSPPTKRQPHAVSTGTSATIRQRPRTASQGSVFDPSISPTLKPFQTSSGTFSESTWPADSLSSQADLEKVIWSRLVETFLTITLPEGDVHTLASPTPSSSTSTQTSTKKGSIPPQRPNGAIDNQRANASSPHTGTRHFRQAASTSTLTAGKTRSRNSSPSVSSSDAATTSPASSASPQKTTFPRSPPLTPPPVTPSNTTSVPIFLSSLHGPSTNPRFELDPEDTAFANWADLSGDRAVVRLWGHVGTEWGHCVKEVNGKGKAKQHAVEDGPSEREDGEWRVLNTWDIKLSDLIPLPDDLAEHLWKLPANTAVITLASSDRAYYIPSSLIGMSPAPSRSHSPEYNSDTEVSRRDASRELPRAFKRGRQRKIRKGLKSTNLNELVRLVSLQASLSDAQNLLGEVLRSCDWIIESDLNGVIRREASERVYRLQCLQERRDILDDNIKSTRDSITSRREQLRQRRMKLAEARALHEDDLLTEFDAGVRLADEKKRVQALRDQIEPIRTVLLSTLAFVFPIELLSPPDLLYTILSVPLPIPLQGTDPAPPLFLPTFSAVNEDSVATALGYAAVVVQLMAAYLCRGLVYPVTYVGSRSLIKDPISAMMGPRMFPLYSKGVDTYRFEYAVFLLNKDIEMLMADRNLRALDLRHTLPNLKNLLLTLTSGESALPRSRMLPSPSVVSITSGLQSPATTPAEDIVPPPLTLDDSCTTPKLSPAVLPATEADPAADDAPVVSSSHTATSSSAGDTTSRARVPRIQIQSYLGFAPLTSMWRSRYSSSPDARKSAVNAAEGMTEESLGAAPEDAPSPPSSSTSSSSDASGVSDSALTDGGVSTAPTSMQEEYDENEDEDDRRTVRGASTPVTPVAETGPDASSFGIMGLDNLEVQICHDVGSNKHALTSTPLGDDREVLDSDAEKYRDAKGEDATAISVEAQAQAVVAHVG